jgi:L-galactose dehydrogenase/L-glyceraldehyde 3-phosphate reductase
MSVSEIGFGCGCVGGLMVRGSPEEQAAAVARALELGINLFDTAAAYGDGTSETNLGRVLRELSAEVVLATKVRLSPDAQSLKAATVTAVEASLNRLGRSYVDLIQIHNRIAPSRATWPQALTPEQVLGPGGVLEGFEALRREGKVRFFGFSGLGEPSAIHHLVDSGRFHTVQVYYNLLNPSAAYPVPPTFSAQDYQRLMDRASAEGMGVAAIRVLAAGALSTTPEAGGGSRSSTPLSLGSEYARDVERARGLGFLVRDDIHRTSQAALRFALMNPAASTALLGFSTPQQIDEAAACAGAGPLPERALEQLHHLWETL